MIKVLSCIKTKHNIGSCCELDYYSFIPIYKMENVEDIKNLLPSSSLVTFLKTTQRCKCKWWPALDFFSSLGKMEAQKENSSDLLFPCWNLLLLVPRRVMSSLVRQTSQGPLDSLRSQWKSKKAQ